MKNGKTIKDLVTDDDYKLLSSFIKEQTGMSLTKLNTFKPFLIYGILYPKMIDCIGQSIEAELIKIAVAQKEEVLGLETVQEQLSVFDEITYEDQLKDLIKSAKDDMKEDQLLFLKMMKIYKNKDLNKLMSIMGDEKYSMNSKQNTEILLINRNKKWIPKIEELIKKKATFIGVGAAHLGGDFGVIKLLREQGYSVKAIL